MFVLFASLVYVFSMFLHVGVVIALLDLVQGSPLAQWAHIVGRDVKLQEKYDYIIVGGGTSGLTVADRLTEQPNCQSNPTTSFHICSNILQSVSVLVIEYGPLDKKEEAVLVPGQLNLTSTPYWYDHFSVPQSGLNGQTFRVGGGKVVGGSSVINGMFFDRGDAEDYNAWEKLGNPGWGWKDLLPFFKKVIASGRYRTPG